MNFIQNRFIQVTMLNFFGYRALIDRYFINLIFLLISVNSDIIFASA
jgi:hypothetical protein